MSESEETRCSKVVLYGETLIDLTADTVTADTLFTGVTAHNAAGQRISGGWEIPEATTEAAGLMSAADKTKLDGIEAGATAGSGISAVTMNGSALTVSNGVVNLGTVRTGSVVAIANGGTGNSTGYIRTGRKSGTTIGSGATIEGTNNTTSGTCSHTEGTACTASGNYSHTEGQSCTAKGIATHSGGYSSTCKGDYSFTHGEGSVTSDSCGISFGLYNVDYSASPFMFGWGSSSARKNIFRVSTSGKVYTASSHYTSGADYAELFEWADGNPKHEDRVGRFVTLDGAKIRLAGPEDAFLFGVVSGCPSICGDTFRDQWSGMCLSDLYGRPIFEEFEVPADLDQDGNVIRPAHTEQRQKLNPAYDCNRQYIPRTERPEWDAVGMLGKLVMLDGGSCCPNGYCTAGDGGIAVPSPVRTAFRVMERLDGSHIRVLILPCRKK